MFFIFVFLVILLDLKYDGFDCLWAKKYDQVYSLMIECGIAFE